MHISMDHQLLTLVTLAWVSKTLLAAVRPDPAPPPRVSHQPTLLWTETGFQQRMQVVGITGQPRDWIKSQSPRIVGEMSRSDWTKYQYSSRIALSFQYSTHTLFWSDVGFKEIHRTRLKETTDIQKVHNLSVEIVYSGTSQQVNGLAVDWLSGSIYWSDALYNWISVASGHNNDIYRQLILTDLNSPMGLVVHPKMGLMYWNSWGAVPKIEVASLAGENRKVFVAKAIDRPLGMAIDYDADTLYWVDDFLDTIERIHLDGTGRHTIHLSPVTPVGPSTLYGLALYQDYLFVTDQLYNTLRIFNKTSDEHIQNVFLGKTPYDIIMYSGDTQENMTSECQALACSHICVSLGQGRGKCLCGHGYDLADDGISCQVAGGLREPMYLYTVGKSLCGTSINVADRDFLDPAHDVTCIFSSPTSTLALGVDVNGQHIFFSDGHDGTIFRRRLVPGGKIVAITTQTGHVRGMAVDWLSSNLYYTDATWGHIMVSRLDGRYPSVLCDDVGTPRGIALNPTKGKMYWVDASEEVVWEADMDCGSRRVFADRVIGGDGLGLDILGERLYWAQTAGIISANLQGQDKQSLISDYGYSYRDVTVYQDYFAWTDGKNGIYFGVKSTGKVLRGFRHLEVNVSHDVIGYSTYLQPPAEGPCDVQNGGCQQMCLPAASGRRCWCALGFTLDVDMTSCISDIQRGRFLLFIDPYHKEVYQLDLTSGRPRPQGVGLLTAEFPTMFDMDTTAEMLYWADQRANIVKVKPLLGGPEQQVLELGQGVTILSLVVYGATGHVIFIQTDRNGSAIYRTTLTGGSKSVLQFVDRGSTLALDERTGFLYWTTRLNSGIWEIYRQSLHEDTNEREKIGESTARISHMTVNYKGRRLYWATNTAIWRASLEGQNAEMVHENDRANFTGLAVVKGHVYCSHWGGRSLFRLNLETLTEQNVTEPSFARITSVKEYWRLPPRPKPIPTVKASSTKEEYDLIWGMPLPVVAGIGAVLLVFIIIIVALSCVLARKRCQKKSLPPIFTPHAHDNPTYITTELPPLPEPVYDAIPAEGATRGTPRDSHNSDLPDIVMTKEGIPLPDRPDLSPEQPSPGMDTASDSLDDESGIEADNFRSFLSDREHLVAGPFPVEVVVNVVDPTNQTVTYNAHL